MPMRFGLSGPDRNNSLEIDASQLKEKLDMHEDVYILDVRTQEEYDAWRLSYDSHEKTPLLPVDRLFADQKSISTQIPKDKQIITLCAHGNRSMMAAQLLSSMGYDVKSVRGGMAAWNQVYDIAQVPIAKARSAKIWQIRRISKGCLGYVIASGEAAVVIDSSCDIDQSVIYLANENKLKILHVIDTHMHADHVSGLSKLCNKSGAQGHISALEGYVKPEGSQIELLKEGSQIALAKEGGSDGGVYLKVINTPGHTDGSICLELYEGNELLCVFTGDTLFVDAVGRPDLRDRTEEFASKLHDTYHSKLLNLPDETIFLPAHYDTNSINLKHNEPIVQTIGGVKANVKLLSMDKAGFVSFLTTNVPPRPLNYRAIIRINKELLPCDQFNAGDLEAGPNSCAVRM